MSVLQSWLESIPIRMQSTLILGSLRRMVMMPGWICEDCALASSEDSSAVKSPVSGGH